MIDTMYDKKFSGICCSNGIYDFNHICCVMSTSKKKIAKVRQQCFNLWN